MTITEMKQRLNAVFQALNRMQVSGYRNAREYTGSMAIIEEILAADIQPDAADKKT